MGNVLRGPVMYFLSGYIPACSHVYSLLVTTPLLAMYPLIIPVSCVPSPTEGSYPCSSPPRTFILSGKQDAVMLETLLVLVHKSG
jgi:hypothetical protein